MKRARQRAEQYKRPNYPADCIVIPMLMFPACYYECAIKTGNHFEIIFFQPHLPPESSTAESETLASGRLASHRSVLIHGSRVWRVRKLRIIQDDRVRSMTIDIC